MAEDDVAWRGSAILSDCGKYRYRLERDSGKAGPVAAIIGVNPSTADAERNDQTIRKDLGFARVHGWTRIIKGNLCAFRATDVRELRGSFDPIGPDNDRHLEEIMKDADIVIGAWGPIAKLPKYLRRRPNEIRMIALRIGRPIHCLGTAGDGSPRHTLMLPYATPLTIWEPSP